MKLLVCLSLLLFLRSTGAHGHHGIKEGETVQQYAQRHMASEHHIDSFDLRSFFQLHDLNQDGVWDREEIEAIYGVHHIYSQKKSKDDIEHQKKADHIVSAVLTRLDTNKDGKITPDEFEAVGLEGLPNFDDMGAEGHHYDIESEFFLHHEEEFHSTPETQTDEAYNHPEDLEHFAHHDEIERKEAEKEAKFEGVTVEEVLEADRLAHEATPPPPSDNPILPGDDYILDHPGGGWVPDSPRGVTPPKPKITRLTPPEKLDPHVRYEDARKKKDEQAEWGSGEGGYKSPTSPVEKMRKNLPYKYKFRRNWGDF